MVNVKEDQRPTAREIFDLDYFRKHMGLPQRSKSQNVKQGSQRALVDD